MMFRERGHSPTEAWDALGIYGGDDGLTADADDEIYVKVCSSTGQVLEAESVKRGESGVKFLAREYGPGIWHGANDSMCDIRRQVAKLHVTVSLPPTVTPLRKLAEKLYSFFLSDAKTPVIGDLATLFVSLFSKHLPKKLGELREVAYYHALAEPGDQYPNEDYEGWMRARAKQLMPTFDFDKLSTYLDAITASMDEEMFLKLPICDEIKPHVSKVALVVNGEVVQPEPELKPKAAYTDEQLKAMATRPCKLHLEGKCKFGPKCRFQH